MSQSAHLPNIVGCAFGFCAAGSGIGSLVGLFVGPWFYPQPPIGHGSKHDQLVAFYGSTVWGIIVGMVIGVVGGIVYAVIVRRSRLKHQI